MKGSITKNDELIEGLAEVYTSTPALQRSFTFEEYLVYFRSIMVIVYKMYLVR